MKKLCELLECGYDIPIEGITEDSRQKGDNLLFFAIRGFTRDGHEFAADAVKNGAVAVVCEHPLGLGVPEIIVPDAARAQNIALERFYDNPLSKMKLIGVTGTDGKTTVSSIVYQLINCFDRCAHIGTKKIRCPDFERPQALTTPLPAELFADLAEFAAHGCSYVSIEASSERLGSKHLDGIPFAASVFTNISRDHLDSHGTLENYALAKAKLFENTSPDGVCVAYNDDAFSELFKEHANAKVLSYGMTPSADVYPESIKIDTAHLEFDMCGFLGRRHIVSPLSGRFNVLNIMAAILCVSALGFPLEQIIAAVAHLDAIEGRQLIVDEGQDFTVMVDFAHTANAVSNLIDYARGLGAGKLIMVLGTGGNRALSRKTDLGKMVIDRADYVYISTYNPRGEEAIDLAHQMLLEADVGKNNFEIELDRKTAIQKAVYRAKPGDVVLITGKGVEYFQLTHGVKIPYEGDYEIAREHIRQRLGK